MNTKTVTSSASPYRVLLTGGRGYLGTILARQFALNSDWVVHCLGRSEARHLELPDLSSCHFTGDVCEDGIWQRVAVGMDAIVHLAAQTSAYIANNNPVTDETVNVRSMLHLLETCRRENWKPTIIFASTVTVVGLPKKQVVGEVCPPEPVTVYDLHKLMAEEYLKLYVRLGHVRGATLRLANVYGPGPRSSQADRGILNVMIRKALAGEPLAVYGTGEWVRDYIYIDDVVAAFAAALNHVDAINGRHWVIGSGIGCTLAQAFQLVAERVELRTGNRVPVHHVEPPKGLSQIENRNFVADVSGFCSATGWRPSVTLRDGIDRTIDAILRGNNAN